MRTLFLYHDHLGEARAAILMHGEDFDTCEQANIDRVMEEAQSCNVDGNFFFVSLENDTYRPDITAEFGDEVPVQFITI